MKIFGNDEILDYPDMNELSRKVVNVYNSEADRDEAIPSPKNGQIVYVSNNGWMGFGGSSGGSGGSWRKLIFVPSGGSPGQVLTIQSDGSLGWSTPAV